MTDTTLCRLAIIIIQSMKLVERVACVSLCVSNYIAVPHLPVCKDLFISLFIYMHMQLEAALWC